MCYIFDKCSKYANCATLSKAYRYNSIMMYHWTLYSLASKSYVSEYRKIVRDLNLVDLQRNIKHWAKLDKQNRYPITVNFSPFITIPILKYILQFKDFIYQVRQKIKH